MSYQVRFKPADISFRAGKGQTILEAAQEAGKPLRQGCLVGACRLCRARLLQGQIAYLPDARVQLSEGEIAENYFLPCCALAASDIECEQDAWSAGRQQHREGALLLDKQRQGEVVILTLQLAGRTQIHPAPGQYVDVQSACGVRRSYSVANVPQFSGRLELHIKRRDGGRFSQQACDAMKPGDILWIHGPSGDFTVKPASSRAVVFVATGTGFAPVKAILESGVLTAERIIRLYWGGRTWADCYFAPMIAGLLAGYQNARFIPVLSQPEVHDRWTGRTGHVQQWIEKEMRDLSGYDVYACGSPAMVRDAFKVMTTRCGLPAEQFLADAFYASAD